MFNCIFILFGIHILSVVVMHILLNNLLSNFVIIILTLSDAVCRICISDKKSIHSIVGRELSIEEMELNTFTEE